MSLLSEGVELEVIWSGGELLPPRDSKPSDTWVAPRRAWNRTGIYAAKGKEEAAVEAELAQQDAAEAAKTDTLE